MGTEYPPVVVWEDNCKGQEPTFEAVFKCTWSEDQTQVTVLVTIFNYTTSDFTDLDWDYNMSPFMLPATMPPQLPDVPQCGSAQYEFTVNTGINSNQGQMVFNCTWAYDQNEGPTLIQPPDGSWASFCAWGDDPDDTVVCALDMSDTPGTKGTPIQLSCGGSKQSHYNTHPPVFAYFDTPGVHDINLCFGIKIETLWSNKGENNNTVNVNVRLYNYSGDNYRKLRFLIADMQTLNYPVNPDTIASPITLRKRLAGKPGWVLITIQNVNPDKPMIFNVVYNRRHERITHPGHDRPPIVHSAFHSYRWLHHRPKPTAPAPAAPASAAPASAPISSTGE